jgi:dolichol-phosphate mannosyltransferase
MFHRVEEGYEVILASPYMYGGGIINTDGLRIFLSKMANVFVKEILGLHGIVTVSSFYRLHHAPVILNLQRHYGPRIIQNSGFECMIEMLIKMVYLQTTMSEIAMVLDTKRRIGKSKMKIWRTIMGYLRLYTTLSQWKKQASA